MPFEAEFVNGSPMPIEHTPAGALSAGQVVVMGELPLISNRALAASELGHLQYGGVWRMAKEAPLVIAIGVLLYWDDTNNRVTTTASTHKKIGYAAKAGASADTYIDVIHKPGG